MKVGFNIYLLFLCVIPSIVTAHFYTPERLAFPALCEKHYSDTRKYTTNTWIEPADSQSFKELAPYLKYLPKPYEADCYGCSGCGGMRLSRRDEFSLPFENPKLAYDELTKLHQQVRYGTLETCRHRGSERCESFCWDGGYFRRMNMQYMPFFKDFLTYSSQNSLCKCFWHERCEKAVAINNFVYRFIYNLAEQKLIKSDFSPYWVSKEIRFDRKGRFYGKEYFPSSHGMASSLTTYLFFYSQYQKLLLDIMASIENDTLDPLHIIVSKDQVYVTLEHLQSKFLSLYEHCLSIHPHPIIYLERSHMKMQMRDPQQALEDLLTMQELAQTEKYKGTDLLSSHYYLSLGKAYAALQRYDEAIETYNHLLEKGDYYHEGLFLRAVAYFETGAEAAALEDYKLSKKSDCLVDIPYKASEDFREALFTGMRAEGNKKRHLPIEAEQLFANVCEEAGRIFSGQSEGLSEEAVQLFASYNQWGDAEKGKELGRLIGKYGIAVFSNCKKIKQVEFFKRLQEAHQICNLTALLESAL